MTAIDNVTEIRCDGPGDYQRCYLNAIVSSAAMNATALRTELHGRGWETIRPYDLPAIDRCPRCGEGTA